MKKNIFLILFFSLSLFSSEFKNPVSSFEASGYVIDLVYKDSKLYVATDAGIVDIFNLKTKKIIQKIDVPKIKDFMGDEVNSKIFSVDEYDGNIMILSKSQDGFNRIHIFKNNKNYLIIDYKQKLAIIKAKYINKNKLLLALLSNEIISYDIKNKKIDYIIQVNGAKFSDFCLSEDKQRVVITDESGDVSILQTKDGKRIDVLSGKNLDNVFQIAYKNGVIATAGQDRRVVIYTPTYKSAYFKQSNFLIYGVALSPSAKLVAYASDEKNNITLFNSITKSIISKFGGNKATISDIEFIDENYFLVASNSKTINLYSVK